MAKADTKAPEPVKAMSSDDEMASLRAQIAALQDRLWALEHPIQEWPKWVDGRVYQSQAEYDAVNPAGKKK